MSKYAAVHTVAFRWDKQLYCYMSGNHNCSCKRVIVLGRLVFCSLLWTGMITTGLLLLLCITSYFVLHHVKNYEDWPIFEKIERISVIKYTHCMLTGPRAYDPGISVCSAGVVDPGSTWRLIGCWLCECWWEACRRISSYLRVMCLCRSIVSALSFCLCSSFLCSDVSIVQCLYCLDDGIREGKNILSLRSHLADIKCVRPLDTFFCLRQCFKFSSVHWHCWLDDRKIIQSLKYLPHIFQRSCFERPGEIRSTSREGWLTRNQAHNWKVLFWVKSACLFLHLMEMW